MLLSLLATLLIGASTINLHAATFSDDNWIRMTGHPGVNDSVSATVVDASGNLYIAGGFTVAGDVFANNIAKWDGTNWTALGSGLNGGVSALAMSGHDLYAAGYFTTAGGVPANSIAKWNGTNWSALGSGITGGPYPYVQSLAVSGDDVYASGYFTNAGGNVVNGIAKWNGSDWSALGSGLSSPATSLAVLGSDLYAGGYFTTADGSAGNRIAKWNGSSWSALGSGIEGPYANVSALATSGNDLYVAGYFSTAGGIAATNMAKWNGSSWSSFSWPFYDTDGRALGARVHHLTISGNDLYAAGTAETDISGSSYYGYVVKWNGSSWSALGPGMHGSLYDAWDPVVSAVAVSGTNVYAGGAFTMVNNRPVNCMVRWNGSEWSAIISSSGQSSVSALAASSNEVYAAGSFTRADGIVSNYVGRWNGSSWSALGSGMIYDVTALAVSGSDLYAAGNFTNVGITANIAKWNGSSWSAVGSGVGGGGVYALAVLGNDLYAGGSFTRAGGIAATNIAKWNGTNWVALGWTGSPYWPVYALAVLGSDLYAGGAFSAADGSPGNYIAKWNGSSWSAVGSGMGGSGSASGSVRALTVVGNDLYAGGDFTTAGGVTVRCVAKWNGSGWSALDSGMTRDDWGSDGEHHRTPHVYALAVSGNDLCVGGYFNTAGDADANYVARWDGSNWSALGSGMDYGVRLLAASGDELFAAGSFTTAGGKLSPSLARARISSSDYDYETNAGTITITRYDGPGGTLTIPDTINGLTVSSIGDWAFAESTLTSVTIPHGVVSIGNNAFFFCTGLTNVTIPNSVTNLGNYTFSGCTALTSITFPTSVTNIGYGMFSGCTGLRSFTIPDNVTYIDGSAFNGCTGLTSFTIPKSVTHIGSEVLSGCTGLTNVTMLNNLAYLPDYLLAYCTALKSFTIPASVTYIGQGVFEGCTFTSFTIPSGVTSVGDGLFEGCTSLTNVVIPSSLTSLGYYMFYGCTGLKSFTIPNGVTYIGEQAFWRCTGLTNVTIPNSVTSIGEQAFRECTGLTSIRIPSSVAHIGQDAFPDCTGLTGLYCEGNAPDWYEEAALFNGSPFVTVFYRSGTTGWGSTYGHRPTALWVERPTYANWAASTGLIDQFPIASGGDDDADGDGLTNVDEWFANTDPTQSASRLELELAPRLADLTASDQTPISAGQRAVYFRSVPGRYYGVQSATELSEAWTLQAVRIASTTQTRFVLPATGPRIFYRVLALP